MTDADKTLTRRTFGRIAAAGALSTMAPYACGMNQTEMSEKSARPNIVYVFADQWRGQAVGYAGDENALTPHIDALAAQSVRFRHAVSGCPVCTPYRASLITGQYWLTHGVFMNDVCLNPEAASIAKAAASVGYDTGYIGKWHLDGHGRSNFTPPERRQGFQYWKALECTHDYNNSRYYAGDDPTPRVWEGYDAIAQTRDAQAYIRDHADGNPFLLMVSWGPPHDPYGTAPEVYRARIDRDKLQLRDNVPYEFEQAARDMLAGYYAHIAVLDDCIGDLLNTLDECGIADNTIFVFTSDHGDMLGSHGDRNKQQPRAESVMVPFLLRWPEALGRQGRDFSTLFNTPDIMPTLLGLADIPIPEAVEGVNYAAALRNGASPEVDGTLITCVTPFGQWSRARGGREYRGVYTGRFTYTRDLEGPWLLYDNERDPYQLRNVCDAPEYKDERERLDGMLTRILREQNDLFMPGAAHIAHWGYEVDDTGTVPYTP